MQELDVIVIGAGASGLACAATLRDLGWRVAILEARNRIGGRIWTLRMADEGLVEVGAQVVHGAQGATWNMIRSAKLHTAPLDRDIAFRIGFNLKSYSPNSLIAAGITAPWSVEANLRRRAWPEQPVSTVLDELKLFGLSRLLAQSWIGQLWSAESDELSAYGIHQIQQHWQAGEGEWHVVEGYDAIPAFLATGLDIRLCNPVHQIRWGQGWVEVESSSQTVGARAAVVTVPPPIVAQGGLLFEPTLPAVKQEAVEHLLLGDALMIIARLSEAAPVSAWSLLLGESGGLWRVDQHKKLLIGSIKGEAASATRRLRLDAALIATWVAPVFPWIQPSSILELTIIDWLSDPYAQGCYTYPRNGTFMHAAEWARPIANTLFFAGEATCGVLHPATVQGALESGMRAAMEICTTLTKA